MASCKKGSSRNVQAFFARSCTTLCLATRMLPMATTGPICPQCKAVLRLQQTQVPRRGAKDGTVKQVVPHRQWVCSSEECMYTANHHVHSHAS